MTIANGHFGLRKLRWLLTELTTDNPPLDAVVRHREQILGGPHFRGVRRHGRHECLPELFVFYFPAHTCTSSSSTRTAASISSKHVHSSGECGLCSPVERFGVGRPFSVSCAPSVPP